MKVQDMIEKLNTNGDPARFKALESISKDAKRIML